MNLYLRTSLAVVALAVAAHGCSPTPDQPAASRGAQATPGSAVRAALQQLSGSFEWNADTMAYVFSNKESIAEIIGDGTESTINELVDCIDDSSRSVATLKSMPVAVGVVCYEALRQLVYYEPTAANGDIAEVWSGHIEPTASSSQLQAAKRAWRDVVDKRTFIRQ